MLIQQNLEERPLRIAESILGQVENEKTPYRVARTGVGLHGGDRQRAGVLAN